ncbi:AAA family ATPase [Sporomusa sphaeroides]|uniref:AAA family ATPase n=1 Tax=Sporomusa sphaeroides TaxID=47679 RepID=UPI003DA1169C
MVNKLFVVQYRKIKDVEFNFSCGINIISGTNGTCKTSLLHLISNAFQSVTKNCSWIHDKACLETIKKVNNIANPKVESLTRGDKQYNDPARGQRGALFTIEYFGRSPLNFRRHNSTSSNRYAVKPLYQRGTKDSLPFCPVIYLGLSRLLPIGEFQNDDALEGVKKNLPFIYQQEIADIYKQFTGLTISTTVTQKMGDIKIRSEFSSDQDGIDSNTISAGEDNLFILITALVSLKYYFNSINSSRQVESILLIDELDATLHPSIQLKILDLFNRYSSDYKIQIFFTTHSLSLIEDALHKKHNVIYLIDNIDSVIQVDSPDIYKIRMYLQSITRSNIYIDKNIPVFTEDEEARSFLRILFDYYADKDRDTFGKVRTLFHFVTANLGADNLTNIFEDTYLIKSTMQSICILDGDQTSKKSYNKHIITLPGKASPEKLIMDYAVILFDNNDEFWTDSTILSLGYTKVYFRDEIHPDIESIPEELKKRSEAGKSNKGITRELNKAVFLKHKQFFELLFRHWLNNPENKDQVDCFYKDLHIMFKKVAAFHGINPKEWE